MYICLGISRVNVYLTLQPALACRISCRGAAIKCRGGCIMYPWFPTPVSPTACCQRIWPDAATNYTDCEL